MILEAAQHITTILNHENITIVATGGIYWELAEPKTEMPFITYSVENEGPATKNGLNTYQVSLRIFAESLTQSANISGQVIDAIKETTAWRNRGAKSGYTDSEAKEAFIEITYNFKL